MFTNEKNDTVRINYLKGYPSLAAFIASDKDKSTEIYRRFDRLSARNLLYLQSELLELQSRQDAFDEADLLGNTETKGIASNWEAFKSKAAESNNTREKERMDLVKEIREKIKEYRKTLGEVDEIKAYQLIKTLEAFLNFFHNIDSPGGSYPTLGGHSAEIYNEKGDLMSLRRPMEEDRLTSFVRHNLPWLFVKQRTHSPLTYISERRLQIFIVFVNIILAYGLLFGAIYHLYSVANARTKLALVAVYTVVFAICVGLVTNAKRSEVFGTCAAYAAVLVVFISGNVGSSSGAPD